MTRPPQASERELVADAIRTVRGGDSEAFARVVETYQRRIFGLVLMMIHDRAGAEDVMQESFIRAYARLERYDQARDFYPWLATISVRLAQNWLRRRASISAHEGVEMSPERGGTSDVLGEVMEDETAQRLWRTVASLPRGERMVVFLHYREGMKVGEVATMLGVADGTVKTMLFRARKKLQRMMTETEAASAVEQEQGK